MTFSFLKGLATAGFLTVTGTAFAGNGQVYLGGALNVNDCAVRAGAQGYTLGVFGAGYDDNGVYYPFWNACFGLGRSGGGGGGSSVTFYDILVDSRYDLSQCASDIEWRVTSADCRANYTENLVECKTRGNRLADIEAVACVRRAYRN